MFIDECIDNININSISKYIKTEYIIHNSTRIDIKHQKTNYGVKKFFECPICGRRRETLYRIKDSYICRTCGNLKYRSNNRYMSKMAKCEKHIFKVLRKLKCELSTKYFFIENRYPPRPKYMKRDKYYKLIKELRHWQCERDMSVIKMDVYLELKSKFTKD